MITGELEGTIHPKIMRSAEDFLPWEKTYEFLQQLERAIENRDEASIQSILTQTVSGYTFDNEQPYSPWVIKN